MSEIPANVYFTTWKSGLLENLEGKGALNLNPHKAPAGSGLAPTRPASSLLEENKHESRNTYCSALGQNVFFKGRNSGFPGHLKGSGEGQCLGELRKAELGWTAGSPSARQLPAASQGPAPH